MVHRLGLDWRISLLAECCFYYTICRNWQAVVRARVRKAPLDHFALRAGPLIQFRGSAPLQILGEIWRKHVYDPPQLQWKRPPQVIVDIGANIGIFSLYAATRWPQARIWAYEPAPENFFWLNRNVHQAPAGQIQALPLAVAAERGLAPFYLKQESGWHSFYRRQDENAAAIEVETVTLPDVLAQTGAARIGFLKMDCEGAEYQILSDRGDWLGQSVETLTLEYHEVGDNRVRRLTSLLEKAGFQCTSFAESRWKTGMLYARNLMLAGA